MDVPKKIKDFYYVFFTMSIWLLCLRSFWTFFLFSNQIHLISNSKNSNPSSTTVLRHEYNIGYSKLVVIYAMYLHVYNIFISYYCKVHWNSCRKTLLHFVYTTEIKKNYIHQFGQIFFWGGASVSPRHVSLYEYMSYKFYRTFEIFYVHMKKYS